MRQPVSSGTSVGDCRTRRTIACCTWRQRSAARSITRHGVARAIVRSNAALKNSRVFPWLSPASLFSSTASACASGPIWLAAAPSASDVCSG